MSDPNLAPGTAPAPQPPNPAETKTDGGRPPLYKRIWFGFANPFRVIGGSFLFLLVVLAASAAFLFFSAAQFQSRVAELAINGTPLSIWRVNQIRSELFAWQIEISQLRKDLAAEKRGLAGNEVALKMASEMHANSANDLLGEIARVRLVVTGQPDTGPQKTVDVAIGELANLIALKQSDEAVNLELKRLRERHTSLSEERVRLDALKSENSARQVSVQGKATELKEKAAEMSRLFGATVVDLAPEFIDRIVNTTSELDAISHIWNGWIYRIALWTNDMVVLLLVISMGLLGSALHLLAAFVSSQKYDDSQALSFGEYPLRLAFGAVTAIVVFIVAKAGIPILADTSKIGGSAPINPYFVSFLAIISGLMSDRALETVRSIASSMLRGAGSAGLTSRYARVSLDDALKQSNRDLEGLARTLHRNSDDTKKLFSGVDAVAPDDQTLISAYLNQPVRDVFSDLPAN